uniref:Uncharacterized protein n=1 Tax=Romanomermis culicivorax TaxID=13658 RepID=A0A915J0J6_ROMCU
MKTEILNLKMIFASKCPRSLDYDLSRATKSSSTLWQSTVDNSTNLQPFDFASVLASRKNKFVSDKEIFFNPRIVKKWIRQTLLILWSAFVYFCCFIQVSSSDTYLDSTMGAKLTQTPN